MTAVEFGPALSLIGLLGAVTLLFKGAVMDWLFNRGIPDAHVRLYVWVLAVSCPTTFLMFTLDNSTLFLVLYAIVSIFTVPFMVFLAPTIQVMTPAHIRGRLTALFLFVFSILGALGPVIVGVLTDFVYQDEAKLGAALGTTLSFIFPTSLTLLWFALPLLRKRIVAEAALA